MATAAHCPDMGLDAMFGKGFLKCAFGVQSTGGNTAACQPDMYFGQRGFAESVAPSPGKLADGGVPLFRCCVKILIHF
jgi:hypothetical protein